MYGIPEDVLYYMDVGDYLVLDFGEGQTWCRIVRIKGNAIDVDIPNMFGEYDRTESLADLKFEFVGHRNKWMFVED